MTIKKTTYVDAGTVLVSRGYDANDDIILILQNDGNNGVVGLRINRLQEDFTTHDAIAGDIESFLDNNDGSVCLLDGGDDTNNSRTGCFIVVYARGEGPDGTDIFGTNLQFMNSHDDYEAMMEFLAESPNNVLLAYGNCYWDNIEELAGECEDLWDTVKIDSNTLLETPYHKIGERIFRAIGQAHRAETIKLSHLSQFAMN